ncbi:MAG: arylesterase [Rhodobacteraceae bacterium]|nr:arylesterase [Paracoccaceae bacterium]
MLSSLAYGAMRAGRNLALTLALPVAAAHADPTTTILALGDSLTAGYGLAEHEGLVPRLNDWLAKNGADAVVLDGGVSGDTSAGGLSRMDWSLTPDVDAMIVTLGGNDLLRGLPPEVTRANIDAILTKAGDRNLPVLLIGMKAPGNFGPDYKTSFDSLYPELAAQHGALHVDSFFGLLDPNAADLGNLSGFILDDGIHPNATGVQKIVSNLGPIVLDLIARTN